MQTRLNTPIHPDTRNPQTLPRTLGPYELIAKLGDGGMADVYLARKRGMLNFRKLVVVKTIKPEFADDPRFVSLLQDEARNAALLEHPKVIDIYDLGFVDNTYFIAMEHLPGQSLTSIIQRSLDTMHWLDVYSAAQIIADAANGLHAVHTLRGLDDEPLDMVHGDVSPGNIVVLYTGHVKLVDFGVAKVHWKRTMIGKRPRAFKIGYAAPEQLLGDAISPVSDVYSLGVAMWELLTHQRLHMVDTPRQALQRMIDLPPAPPSDFRPSVPRELDAICIRAMQIDSRERFRTAAEMQHELEAVLREAGRFRESEHIETFMGDMFSDVREKQAAMVRQISAGTKFLDLTAAGVHPDTIISVATSVDLVEVDPDDDDDDVVTEPAPYLELVANQPSVTEVIDGVREDDYDEDDDELEGPTIARPPWLASAPSLRPTGSMPKELRELANGSGDDLPLDTIDDAAPVAVQPRPTLAPAPAAVVALPFGHHRDLFVARRERAPSRSLQMLVVFAAMLAIIAVAVALSRPQPAGSTSGLQDESADMVAPAAGSEPAR